MAVIEEMLTVNCKRCGEPFEYRYMGGTVRNYCSNRCLPRSWTAKRIETEDVVPSPSGRRTVYVRSPSDSVGVILSKFKHCGEEITVKMQTGDCVKLQTASQEQLIAQGVL